MNTSAFQFNHLVDYNLRFIRFPSEGPPAVDAPITLIISGVEQQQTNMIAALIGVLGIPVSKSRDKSVLEDIEFTAALECFDWRLARSLIEKRDNEVTRWAFKFPMLSSRLLPIQIERFRNPYLIVVIDERKSGTSFFVQPYETKVERRDDSYERTEDMMRFVQRVACPVLIIEYNEFLQSPERTIRGLTKLCGLEIDQATKESALIATSGVQSGLFYFPRQV